MPTDAADFYFCGVTKDNCSSPRWRAVKDLGVWQEGLRGRSYKGTGILCTAVYGLEGICCNFWWYGWRTFLQQTETHTRAHTHTHTHTYTHSFYDTQTIACCKRSTLSPSDFGHYYKQCGLRHTLPEQASGFLCLAHFGLWGRSTIVGRVLCGLLSMITFLIAYFLCLLLPSVSLFRSAPSSCGHSNPACKLYVNPWDYSRCSVEQGDLFCFIWKWMNVGT